MFGASAITSTDTRMSTSSNLNVTMGRMVNVAVSMGLNARANAVLGFMVGSGYYRKEYCYLYGYENL